MPVKSTYLELVSDITVKLTGIAWSLSEKKKTRTCSVQSLLYYMHMNILCRDCC